jgi:hypothetical protein
MSEDKTETKPEQVTREEKEEGEEVINGSLYFFLFFFSNLLSFCLFLFQIN